MQPNGIRLTADPLTLLAEAQAVVDFTTPMVSTMLADLAAQARIVHVIGTTGFDEKGEARIKAAARHAVIVKSGNMSMGVNLLAALAERAARSLPDYDIEVLEMHHRNKVDAPSGTALLLGEAAARGRAVVLNKHAVKTRDGHTGTRKDGDIGFATLRGGTVVGRAFHHLRRHRRAHYPEPFRRGPFHLRSWRADGGEMGPWQEARPLFHDGCAGAVRQTPAVIPGEQRIVRCDAREGGPQAFNTAPISAVWVPFPRAPSLRRARRG